MSWLLLRLVISMHGLNMKYRLMVFDDRVLSNFGGGPKREEVTGD